MIGGIRKKIPLVEIVVFVYTKLTDYLIEKARGIEAQKSQVQELQYQNSLLME